MPTQLEHTPLGDKREITRLLRAASEGGQAGQYAGRVFRVRVGGYLQANRVGSATRLLVILRDISDTGLAFWSKKRFTPRSRLFIREFSEDERPWLLACVRHCTIGMRGFLIGAVFDAAGETRHPAASHRRQNQRRRDEHRPRPPHQPVSATT